MWRNIINSIEVFLRGITGIVKDLIVYCLSFLVTLIVMVLIMSGILVGDVAVLVIRLMKHFFKRNTINT
jgi:hypothetical protein